MTGRRSRGPALQLVPAGAFYALAFIVPLAILLAYSVWTLKGFEVVPELTSASYEKTLGSPLYQAIFLRTVGVGLAVAAVVVPIAYLLAYAMRFILGTRGRIVLDLVLISMFSGYLVRIYAWRTVLGKEGLLNAALLQLGVIAEPVTFLVYSNVATVITLVGMLIPLAVLPIWSSMSNVSRDHLEGAADLGATGIRLHRTVLVPMVLPGLSTAFAIAFILAAGDFVVPLLVGGTSGILAGNLVADQFRGLGADWPLGASIAVVVMVLMVAITLIVRRLTWLVTRW